MKKYARKRKAHRKQQPPNTEGFISCGSCGGWKHKSKFRAEITPQNTRRIHCRECLKESLLAYIRTRVPMIKNMYRTQKESCRKRKHPQPEYSMEEFVKWVLAHPNFERLFKAWVKSGYDRWKKPSIDRLINERTYSFENIKLKTWKQNYDAEAKKRKSYTEPKKYKRYSKRVKYKHLVIFEQQY